jgi:hypothetical protein
MPIWCWRVPFLLSSIIALIAMYLCGKMQETNIFKLAKKDNQLFDSPIYAAWKYNKEGLLCTAAFALFISVLVYTGNIYYKTMAVNIGKLNPQTATTIITFGILLTTILIPIAAILADKTNGYKICLSGILLAIIFSPIIMDCAQSGNIILTLYSGSSIAWSVTTAIFGGSTLLVNELLIGHFKLLNGPGLYISISALICITIVLLTTYRQDKTVS